MIVALLLVVCFVTAASFPAVKVFRMYFELRARELEVDRKKELEDAILAHTQPLVAKVVELEAKIVKMSHEGAFRR